MMWQESKLSEFCFKCIAGKHEECKECVCMCKEGRK